MKLQLLTMEDCIHCGKAKQILEEVKPDFPDLEVEEIDVATEQGQELVQKYGIMATPGIIINGKLFSTGGLDKEKLIERLKEGYEVVSASPLTKLKENPIISPRAESGWEAWQTFNPGVILLKDRVHFLYRAIGEDGISRLGYAASADGFHIDERLSYPVYEHCPKPHSFNIFSYTSGGSWGGAEDPRLVQVDQEDVLYMTYTACDKGLRVALTSIKAKDFLAKRWHWKKPVLISRPGQVHKNWVIFPEKIGGQYAILHSICPTVAIAFRDSLEFKEGDFIESYYDDDFRKKDGWDNRLRGAGAPPIKTEAGWLLFYQAMDEKEPGKYKVGAMLLGLDEPTKILYRAQEPVLEPEENYENNGFKAGVVYVTGAVIKDNDLLVYYGAADSYIGLARTDLEEFLKALSREERPKLKASPLKKKQDDY